MIETLTAEPKTERDYRRPKENPLGQDMFFDIRKTLDLYHTLRGERGQQQADKIMWKILREDLNSIGWEAVDTNESYDFCYQFIKTGDGNINVVHESDDYNQKSILEGLNGARRGTEFAQGANFVDEVNKLYKLWDEAVKKGEKPPEDNWTIFLASPKFDPTKDKQGDCYYPDTFFTWVNVKFDKDAKDGVAGVGFASQAKSKHINTKQAAFIRNFFSDSKIDIDCDLDEVITNIGCQKGGVGVDEVNSLIEQASGLPFAKGGNLRKIKDEAAIGAWLLLWGLQQQKSVEELNQLHSDIVFRMVKGQPSSKISYREGGGLILETGCSKIFGRDGRNTSTTLKSLLSSNSESSEGIKCSTCHYIHLCGEPENCRKCGMRLNSDRSG